MTQGIYCITNTATGDRYIGSSVSAESRIYSWRLALTAIVEGRNAQYCVNKLMQNSVREYGLSRFTFEILEDCSHLSRYELRKREQQWIDTLNPGFNIHATNPAPFDFKSNAQKEITHAT